MKDAYIPRGRSMSEIAAICGATSVGAKKRNASARSSSARYVQNPPDFHLQGDTVLLGRWDPQDSLGGHAALVEQFVPHAEVPRTHPRDSLRNRLDDAYGEPRGKRTLMGFPS